ncbi:MAG: hypothetical protein GF315_13115 [candidate division Zixibacteria bacterium]|nr:hypothetical protein [candidate division Zixibacteria bacterium]
MAKKRKKKPKGNPYLGTIIIILGILIGISIFTYDASADSGIAGEIWNLAKAGDFRGILRLEIANAGGIMGAFISSIVMFAFGLLGFLIPLLIIGSGVNVFTGKGKWHLSGNTKVSFAILILFTVLLTIPIAGLDASQRSGYGAGGAVGYLLAKVFKLLVGTTGAYFVTVLLILAILSILYPKAVKSVVNSILRLIGWVFISLFELLKNITKSLISRKPATKKGKKSKVKIIKSPTQETKEETAQKEPEKPFKVNIKRQQDASQAEEEPEEPITPIRTHSEGEYNFPDISLLDKAVPEESSDSDTDIEERAEILKNTLATFGVKINEDSVESYPGPVITRFEFQPASGIKISQIASLADDLALAMKAQSIRIVAPIPGKGAVGVEIPNKKPQVVKISEIISSPEFRSPKYLIPLALGKDIGGQPFIADLAKMPHLLIAGATGSGKSVCINAIITSIIYKLHPDQARFIFIDPKMLELSIYSGIPHLERPVVTKASRSEKVLQAAVEEMEDRYSQLAEAGVRNIQDYNKKCPENERLPYVIIIVDELADLMMGTSNKIELMITRLAQMARAVGIHLILATQRPSVDVITGLIKANFSSRIAFQVASKVDSRTILDANGAEKLLGAGDMLVMLTGQAEIVRVHGSYVSGEETSRIVDAIGEKEYKPKPVEALQPGQEPEAASSDTVNASDELFRQAAETVVLHKQGSVSLLQRKLGVGYQRAARLIDQLEEAGVVGPYEGSKSRKVLINEQGLMDMFSGKVNG